MLFRSQRADRYQQAADAFRDVLKTEPKNANAMHYLGLALWQITQQPDEALKLMRKSMKLSPGSAVKNHNIAAVYGSLGQIKKAASHYKKSIELTPDYAEAYFNLSGVYRFEQNDPLIAQMQALYAGNELSDPDREFLTYALSKAMNDTKNYHEAFHFALEGARLKTPQYDTNDIKVTLTETRKYLSKDALLAEIGRAHV